MKWSLLIFLISFNLSAKLVVISDLDETLRISQTHNYLVSLVEIIKGVKPFTQMRTLFTDLDQQEQAKFIYVSASYYKFYNGQKWIDRQHFPHGKVYQKPRLALSSKDFKLQALESLYQKGEFDASDSFLFFGDNSSHDEEVYLEFREKHSFDGDIYIRDIKSKATALSSYLPLERKEGIHYFYTEWQLLKSPLKELISPSTVNSIQSIYNRKLGQVLTQRVYLEKKLKEKICGKRRLSHLECSVLVRQEMQKAKQHYFAQ